MLRRYINERYGINSLEMTSAEILTIIRTKSEEDSVYENLKQVLIVADLVKFAKYHPLIEEDEKSLSRAYSFVENTKQVVEETQAIDDDVTNKEV